MQVKRIQREAMQALIAAGQATPAVITDFNQRELTRYTGLIDSTKGPEKETACRDFGICLAAFDDATKQQAIQSLCLSAALGAQPQRLVLTHFARASGHDDSSIQHMNDMLNSRAPQFDLMRHLLPNVR